MKATAGYDTICRRFPGWLAPGAACVLAAGQAWMPACRASDPVKTRIRVAMMDFTSDDGLMRSAAGAAQWSALAQDGLARQEPDLDWVERAQLQTATDELNLSVGGYTSADGSLRVGHWLQAKLAILGRFIRNAKDDDGHALRLDIVDLDRADTLATRTLHLDGDRRNAIAPDPALVPATVAALHEALAEAREKLSRSAHQKVVAALFFHNADLSPRLNGFEAELMDAFTRASVGPADVRVLRFPQAGEARGEAEMAMCGLSENDADAWRHVADLYVWGAYHELPAPEATFAQTPVEVELTAWDGVHAPLSLKERAVVAQLPALAGRLVDRCLNAARRVPVAQPAAAALRGEIARSLREQGARLEATAASHGEQRRAFLESPEGGALTRQQRSLLEAACFFAPGDREAELARLRTQWENFPAPVQRLPFLDLWRRSNDLANFAGRFGGASPELVRARVDADAYMLEWLRNGEQQVHAPGDASNLPYDATDKDIAAWHDTLDARFTRDVLACVKGAAVAAPPDDKTLSDSYATWMRTALEIVRDPSSASRTVEALWPYCKPFYQRNTLRDDQRYDDRRGGFMPALQRLYAGLHEPDRAAAILGTLSSTAVVPAATRATVTAVVLPTASATGLARLTPTFRTIHFPSSTSPESQQAWGLRAAQYTVQNLITGGDDVLWISVDRQGGGDLSASPNQQTQELWRFDPVDDTLQKLPVEGLTLQTPITALLPLVDRLWLTLGLTGVWRYDPARTQVTHRFTTADGLLTANMDSGATVGGRLYFAGHENGRPLLNGCDLDGREWSRVDLPTAIAQPSPMANEPRPRPIPGLPPTPPTAQITVYEHWLLVRLGESWTLVDTRSRQTQTLRAALPGAVSRDIVSFAETVEHPGIAPERVPLPRPRPCTADARGFWIAVEGKVICFDPAHPATAKSWSLPPELADGVTALAADGDDLWMAGPAGVKMGRASLYPQLGQNGRGFLAVLHEADGRWRGSFELPASVGCLAMNHQTVYADQQLAAQPLLEIDKRATLAAAAP